METREQGQTVGWELGEDSWRRWGGFLRVGVVGGASGQEVGP